LGEVFGETDCFLEEEGFGEAEFFLGLSGRARGTSLLTSTSTCLRDDADVEVRVGEELRCDCLFGEDGGSASRRPNVLVPDVRGRVRGKNLLAIILIFLCC
jgi:hypothetical protein